MRPSRLRRAGRDLVRRPARGGRRGRRRAAHVLGRRSRGPRRLRRRRACARPAAARCCIPWPNRLEDGSYEFDGQRHQLPLTEPEHANAIHGLVRWAAWTRRRARARSRRDGARAAPAARLPVLARAQHRVRALPTTGSAVRTTATNVGPTPARTGAAQHPYLTVGTATVDSVVLRAPGADGAALRRARSPHGLRRRSTDTEYDFRGRRAIGATRLDNAFTDLERDDDGLARVELRDPDGGRGAHALGRRELPLPDALHRRPAARRRTAAASRSSR